MGLGAAYLAGAGLVLYFQASRGLLVYLATSGMLILVSVLLQRGRYRPLDSPGADLQPTGERFRDPVSGKLIEVRSDPATGKRAYKEVPD